MDQKPPAKLSPIIIFLVLLFNLIWIVLVFMSCQVDNDARREVTPDVETGSLKVWEEFAILEDQNRPGFATNLRMPEGFGQFDVKVYTTSLNDLNLVVDHGDIRPIFFDPFNHLL